MSYKSYVAKNQDLQNFYNKNIRSTGKSMAAWGKHHWETHAKGKENRRITPHNSGPASSAQNSSPQAGGNPNAVTPNYTPNKLYGSNVLPSANPANPTKAQYASYVDNALTGNYSTWDLIEARLAGKNVSGMTGHQNMSPEATADYWITRMGGGKSKADFGKAHYDESVSLHKGTYLGGTKVPAGTGVRSFGLKSGGAPGPASGPGAGGKGPMADASPGGTTLNDIQPMQLANITDNMMLSNAVSDLINTNSPLFRAAETRALQAMAARGIVNSSLARESVMNAIMQVALPIAQADVTTLQQNLYYNTDWTNQQKTAHNQYVYDTLKQKLEGAIAYTLRRGDWIAAIGSTPGMSTEAINWSMGNLPNYQYFTGGQWTDDPGSNA